MSRLTQAFLGLAGIPGPVTFVSPAAAERASVGLAVLGAALVLIFVVLALQPAAGPRRLDVAERDAVRHLLSQWGEADSLSWFALREDRAVLFSPSRKAAVSYRIVGGVSLAAGDPLGDPEAWPGAISAWLEEAGAHGWVPDVLGASEQGAAAYHRAGLDALELGDEAILQTADFTTEGRRMRVVRQAVSRCRRAGLDTTCQRVRDLNEATRAEVVDGAEAWRDREIERGFSMALGRLADPVDSEAVLVTCRDRPGRLRGLLQLVPWGRPSFAPIASSSTTGAGWLPANLAYVAAQVALLEFSLRAVGLLAPLTIVLMAAAIERLSSLVPLTPGVPGSPRSGPSPGSWRTVSIPLRWSPASWSTDSS